MLGHQFKMVSKSSVHEKQHLDVCQIDRDGVRVCTCACIIYVSVCRLSACVQKKSACACLGESTFNN